ncbi:MAG TPA: hydrogenase maturation nickel metallochaperone HypA [Polyangiaceae bacterium]|nr:hydrogenase maturation nickel metallochaperone HypA [Polyangiaceae bacterium]
MHEASLVQALFDRVDTAICPHPPAAVRSLTVRIGELAGVDADLFRTAFEVCRDARGYAAAKLQVTVESACWACRDCRVALGRGEPLQCPACGGPVTLSSGGGLFVDRVEMEVIDV